MISDPRAESDWRPRRGQKVQKANVRNASGGADLSEDLGFTPNPRVEPGGDSEEVTSGLVVSMPVERAVSGAQGSRRRQATLCCRVRVARLLKAP